MSLEAIPKEFRQPFDPLQTVDHQRVAEYTLARLETNPRGVKAELRYLFDYNRTVRPELIERLINIAKYLEPVDDDLMVLDETLTRSRQFSAGSTLALASVANLAYELEVPQLEWRSAWADLPEGIEAPLRITISQQHASQDCYRLGAALMDQGSRNLADLEMPYGAMLRRIEDAHSGEVFVDNVFRASFGFVMGVGRHVLRDIVYDDFVEDEVFRLLPDYEDHALPGALDQEYARLLEEETDGMDQ